MQLFSSRAKEPVGEGTAPGATTAVYGTHSTLDGMPTLEPAAAPAEGARDPAVPPARVVDGTLGGVVEGGPAVRVAIAEFVQHVAPAYGGDTWPQVVQSLMAYPAEAETVHALRAVLDAGQEFVEPIRVDRVTDEDHEHLPPRVHGQWRFSIGDGMHRTVAHLLNPATTTITIREGWTTRTESCWRITALPTAPEDLHLTLCEPDTHAAVWSVLRSVPVPTADQPSAKEGARPARASWVVSDLLAYSGHRLELYYSWPDDVDSLVKAVHAKAAQYGITLTDLTVEEVHDDPDEDADVPGPVGATD